MLLCCVLSNRGRDALKERSTVYFSVDVEASGPLPPEYNLVSIGAVEVRATAEGFTTGRELYVELKPIFPGFRKSSMAVHGITREHLEENGVEAGEAMRRFASWTAGCLAEGEKPVFVGHNAVFDWAYINFYFHHFGIENVFGYKAIDSKSLAMGALGISWWDANKDYLLKKLPGLAGLAEGEVAHNALHDARFQARILIALLERIR
ncbi:MAG: 3'-5' exonuclease [Candidatus Eisenbacteria bacterium]|nr:3'-5' exonuclease [Candidatus Latescibacterota bacterium]MBD3302117.1 3'-5' exonuclease [Candidatus Eisenbacteria bacterium]